MPESSARESYNEVLGTPYFYSQGIDPILDQLSQRVANMRAAGRLTRDALARIREFFRLKSIYHSNAIEGSQLNLGETRLVVEQGLTITGKPLKDSAEARNLAHALEFFESLASATEPIDASTIRQIHALILKDIDDSNAGKYRSMNVEISGSAYKPPEPFKLSAEMDELCEWLATAGDSSFVEDPIATAAAAHAWFVGIHPFLDGNGRTARILMNLILMRAGYPIAVITKDERGRYYESLEESQGSDLTPFMLLVAESVEESLEEYERAIVEQTAQQEWAQALAAKFTAPQRVQAENYYEVWRSAMELLKNYVRQSAYVLNEEAAGLARIYFEDFGTLEFDKYLSLRDGKYAKRTWLFRVDFRSPTQVRRFLFFFGWASQSMRQELSHGDRVTLHVSTEESPYVYERLDNLIRPDLPETREVGYNASDEQFLVRSSGDLVQPLRMEELVRNFFEQVIKKGFA